jgi:hypothetical protein
VFAYTSANSAEIRRRETEQARVERDAQRSAEREQKEALKQVR